MAFSLASSKTHRKDIYTANPDGSDLFQVTHTGLQDFAPDWGLTRFLSSRAARWALLGRPTSNARPAVPAVALSGRKDAPS